MKRNIELAVGDSSTVRIGHLVRALQQLQRPDLIPLSARQIRALTAGLHYNTEEMQRMLVMPATTLQQDLLALLSEDMR